jgi:hypothetical protein
MKQALRTLLMITAMLLAGGRTALLLPGVLYAFHEGGAGYCDGCHDLHSPVQGSGKVTNEGDNTRAGVHMLKGTDPSSTCLICHAEAGVFYSILSKDGSQYTPGGDFYWLKKTFTSTVNGMVYMSEGDNHGHNIIAADYGLGEDKVLNSAPGGAYASSAMGCSSCHNPHGIISGNANNSKAVSVSGSYGETAPPGTITGNYRLLGGTGYDGGKHANAISFAYPAPVAVAHPKDWFETDANHPAYGSGMSEWCGNCHNDMLNSSGKHPAGNNALLSRNIIANYNAYVRTGNSGGTRASSYLSLVPFELGTADMSRLVPSRSSGPDTSGKANVMCLTCHRAHASAFPFIGRWDFKATFMADSHPKPGDSGVTGNDVMNSYYGRNMIAQFGRYQRQLCNKCHMQD